MIEYTEYTKMLIGLIAIVNPIGAVPIFISLTTGLDDKARRTIYRTTTYAVFLILMAALILGEAILDFFGITIIPLLAGPGAISTVILYAHRDASLLHYSLVALVILLLCVLLFLAFRSVKYISQYLSQTAVNVFARIMGLILAAIAIEIIANGVKGLFPDLA
jgi:multiple antibiotic resistance protein